MNLRRRASQRSPDDDEEKIHQALLVIDSKIGVLDGKVNLIGRANAPALLGQLRDAVRKNPIIGHIYLLLDGERNQEALVAALHERGISSSKQAVSRWIADHLLAEHGMVELVPTKGRSNIYRKNKAFEQALNLTKKVEGWLAEIEKETKTKGKMG